MANKSTIEAVSRLLQFVTGQSLPFGGKILIALGDFRQVAPVIKNAGPSATLDASIQSCSLWSHFHVLSLTLPVRNALDPLFSAWVDMVGEGDRTSPTNSIDLLPAFASFIFDIEHAVSFLFPFSNILNHALLARRSFLSPLNSYVDEFNQLILATIPGNEGIILPNLHVTNLHTNQAK